MIFIGSDQFKPGVAPSSPGVPKSSALPELPGRHRWLSVHPDKVKAIWIHEYTHGFLQRNRPNLRGRKRVEDGVAAKMRANPELAAAFDRQLELQRRYLQLGPEVRETIADINAEGVRDSETMRRLVEETDAGREIHQIEIELEKLEEKLDSFDSKYAGQVKAYLRIRTAMEEVFCDTVPGVQLGDMDAFSKAYPAVGTLIRRNATIVGSTINR